MKKKNLPSFKASSEELDSFRKKFVIAALRRVSFRWPGRSEAKKEARVGYGVYVCRVCGGLLGASEGRLDHILPVVPVRGFSDWDDYLYRLLPPSTGFQLLCEECHETKTRRENEERKRIRDVGKLQRNRKKV